MYRLHFMGGQNTVEWVLACLERVSTVMPLRIKLRAEEKVIINGALISARQPTALLVHNRVSLLRERQIIPPQLANTPARRIYFSIQCAYVAPPEEQEEHREQAKRYASEFGDVIGSPRMREIIGRILGLLRDQSYYEALKFTQDVMRYEDFVLKQPSWEKMNESAGH